VEGTKMRYKEIIKRLKKINPNAILVEDLDEGVIGYTQNKNLCVAVYDFEKCLCLLSSRGMSSRDSSTYLENIMEKIGNNPIFVTL